jgi:four helix bundle protein
MRNDKDNIIVDLTTDFALMAIEYCEKLEQERKYVIARQLLRSATSIAANVREAQNAESTDDFIHKFKVAAKECDETDLWFFLCQNAPSYPKPDAPHIARLEDIQRVISKIISTTKRRRRR